MWTLWTVEAEDVALLQADIRQSVDSFPGLCRGLTQWNLTNLALARLAHAHGTSASARQGLFPACSHIPTVPWQEFPFFSRVDQLLAACKTKLGTYLRYNSGCGTTKANTVETRGNTQWLITWFTGSLANGAVCAGFPSSLNQDASINARSWHLSNSIGVFPSWENMGKDQKGGGQTHDVNMVCNLPLMLMLMLYQELSLTFGQSLSLDLEVCPTWQDYV